MRVPGASRSSAVLIFFLLIPRLASPQGDPLGPEFRVNTYTTGFQRLPIVAADASGNFVVVWMSPQQDGDLYGIFGQRYASSGSPAGPEFRVNTVTTGNQLFASVAGDASGNFVVVWESPQDGDLYGVFGQRYASSGAPVGPEFRVNTYTTRSQEAPAVAADALGNFTVVWQSNLQDGGARGIFAQRYASSGAPLGTEFRVNTYTTSNQRYPTVAANPAGDFVVAWDSFGQDGSTYGVFAQRYASSGVPLGPEFRVNTFTPQYQVAPGASVFSSGDFVLAWTSYAQDGFYGGIYGRRYASSGAPLGSEFRINTYWTDYQRFPSIAADPAGNFVVVWHSESQDGSNSGIFGQRFLDSGAPVGPEFRVNTFTPYYQAFPSVSADASGNFVVVWYGSFGLDGSGTGIFGQRFSQVVPVKLVHFGVR